MTEEETNKLYKGYSGEYVTCMVIKFYDGELDLERLFEMLHKLTASDYLKLYKKMQQEINEVVSPLFKSKENFYKEMEGQL